MSRPRFCPSCGAALIGESAAVGIYDDRSGDGGYDTYCCRSRGWSEDVMPDDEQGEYRRDRT